MGCHRIKMKNSTPSWRCIKNCGACCRLAPEERSEAIEVLSQDQLKIYFELVKPDGWCRHYDSGSRKCRIYANRPDFCQIGSLFALYNIQKEHHDDFAIECCSQQIRSVYGGRSNELRRFKRATKTSEISS